jgi:hypothetical protein
VNSTSDRLRGEYFEFREEENEHENGEEDENTPCAGLNGIEVRD